MADDRDAKERTSSVQEVARVRRILARVVRVLNGTMTGIDKVLLPKTSNK